MALPSLRARTAAPAAQDPTDPDGRPPWNVAVPLELQHVLAMSTSNLALVLVGRSLLPQVAAVPPAVLGGGVLVLFGMVCAIGVQMLARDGLDTRSLLVVALSLALGRGIASVPGALDRVTGQWGALFDSGIVVAAVVAVVLDLVLPGLPGARQAAASAAQ
ncbi:solute carrier family 23 protein [Geodermatophilus sp. SYSU D00698]